MVRLLALLLPTPALAQDAAVEWPYYVEAGEVMQVVPPRIDNPDGTWYRAIRAEDVPTEPVVQGALTWEYVGQARFTDAVPSRRPRTVRTGGPGRSALASLYDSVRVDHLGREWRVIAVDLDLACVVAGQDPAACDIDVVPPDDPVQEGVFYPHGAAGERRPPRRSRPDVSPR